MSASVPRPTAPRNPHLVALTVIVGVAWTLSFMLWIVHASVTDYAEYDVAGADQLLWWVHVLLVTGGAAALGAVVIAGVRRELRREPRS